MPKAIKNPDGSFRLLGRGRPPKDAIEVIIMPNGSIKELPEVPIRQAPEVPVKQANDVNDTKVAIVNALPAKIICMEPAKIEDPRLKILKAWIFGGEALYKETGKRIIEIPIEEIPDWGFGAK